MRFYNNLPEDYQDYSQKNFQRTLLKKLSENGVVIVSQGAAERAIGQFFHGSEEWEGNETE